MPIFAPRSLSLELPAGWTDHTQFAFSGPVVQGIQTNVVVLLKASTLSVNHVWAEQKLQIKKHFRSVTMVGEKEETMGAHQGLWVEVTGEVGEASLYQAHFFTAIARDTVLHAVGTCAASASRSVRGLFRDAVASITLEPSRAKPPRAKRRDWG